MPPAPTHWFTDAAGVVDASTSTQLDQKLSAFEKRSGAQFIIYIFPALDGEPLEDFTIRCVEKWKVGNKKYDNGLVLFIFARDRKVRIEVGYGLESVMTDAYSSRVIRNDLAPHLQKNDWAGGLNAAADDIMARISGGTPAVAPVTQSGRGTAASGRPGCADVLGLIVLFLIFIFVILPLIRRGGCSGCFLPMMFLGGGGGGGFTMGGGGGSWGGGGGFSGGGGSFGGGGASGGW